MTAGPRRLTRHHPALIRRVLADAERMTWQEAADRNGVSRSVIGKWMQWQRESGGRWLDPAHDAEWEARDQAAAANRDYRKRAYVFGKEKVDSTGTRRRMQALYALGWTWEQLGAELGGGKNRAWRLAHKEQDVYRATARRVAAIYDCLSATVPPGWVATRARGNARRYGWAPPLAWDDIDRDQEPYAEDKRRGGRPVTSVQALEDFDWLLSCGESPEQAARRVGLPLGTLRDYRTRLARRVA